MRIAMLVPVFPRSSETFIVSKFLGLFARGWDIRIICAGLDRNHWQALSELRDFPGIQRRVYVGWSHRPRWLAALLAPLALAWCLLRYPGATRRYLLEGWKRFGWDTLRRFYLDAPVVRCDPDILHFEFGTLAVERMYLKELLGCRVVVSFRGYDLNFVGLENHGYYDPVWNGADALHLLGADLWQRALRRGCPAGKLHALIPPAIDPQYFEPKNRENTDRAGEAERPLRILSVGRLEWKKGYEYALQAIRLILDQGKLCEYRIVGNGTYLEPVAFARHQLGLDQVVHFAGEMKRDAVKEQMLWADVFLHPAVSEGFCNAVLEAQAMALPVVCTNADGLPENVSDGKTGFVVGRRDPRALAVALARLAQDPELRCEMGRAGRARVLGLFQLSDQIEAFDRLYRETMHRPQVVSEPSALLSRLQNAN